MLKRIGGIVFWLLTVVAVGTIVVLMVASGLYEVKQNQAAGEPWFSGFQAASSAIPIAALIAAGVAITTARWGLRSERERRETERRDATERALRDRFHELVKLLSADELRSREGAAYAIAALADDWKTHYDGHDPTRAHAEQQVCINVLIAQLHDPITDSTENSVSDAQLIAFKHAIQAIISSRLGRVVGDRAHSGDWYLRFSQINSDEVHPGVWSSCDFIFDGCTFHNLELAGRVFDGGEVSFTGAHFAGHTSVTGARFDGDTSFDQARFAGDAWFTGVRFAGEPGFTGAWFSGARFAGDAWFGGARFAGDAWFGAHFDGRAEFVGARFTGSALFGGAHFTGPARFHIAHFDGHTSFNDAHFDGHTSFDDAHFDGDTSFRNARFDGDTSFRDAHFTKRAWFDDAHFASAQDVFEKAHFEGESVALDNTYFDVAPADFPECEVCNELRASQGTAGVQVTGRRGCRGCRRWLRCWREVVEFRRGKAVR